MSLLRDQGLVQSKPFSFFFIKANFHLNNVLVFVSERRGVHTRCHIREAELKTVVETGNGFNRLGLPLSPLPQQARRIIQDYRARLWSAVRASCQERAPLCLSCMKYLSVVEESYEWRRSGRQWRKRWRSLLTDEVFSANALQQLELCHVPHDGGEKEKWNVKMHKKDLQPYVAVSY